MTGLEAEHRPRLRPTLAVSLAALAGAAATIALAATLALFSNSAHTQPQQFAAGTVTLTRSASSNCSATNLLPGSAPPPCTLTVTYTGSDPAYLGLDILIETQAGNGGTNLYNPADPTHDLQISITSTSPSVTYTLPATATTCPAGAPAGSSCYELDKQLVATTAFTNTSPPVTFNTIVSLPASTTTGYRGGSAQIILGVHPAQSANNPATGCTAGLPCSTLSWS